MPLALRGKLNGDIAKADALLQISHPTPPGSADKKAELRGLCQKFLPFTLHVKVRSASPEGKLPQCYASSFYFPDEILYTNNPKQTTPW